MGLIDVLREPKVLDIAVFDVACTLGVAYVTRDYMFPESRLWEIFLGAIALGIVTHVLVGVPTMLNHYLGLSRRPARAPARPQ